MSLYQNIRGALQTRAATASGFPPVAQRAYENRLFTSTTGVPYARMTLIPSSGRPFSLSGARRYHNGMFQVDIFYPTLVGTAAAEQVADAVRAVFVPGTKVPLNGDMVLIAYSERHAGLDGKDWLQIPVTIGWSCLSDKD